MTLALNPRLPQLSGMTVYRILGTLVSLGLVSKTCHPGWSVRFDPKIHQHHHLVCLDCGGIIDVEDARLNRIPWPDVRRHEFQIEDYSIHFRGRCAGGNRAAPDRPLPQSRPALRRRRGEGGGSEESRGGQISLAAPLRRPTGHANHCHRGRRKALRRAPTHGPQLRPQGRSRSEADGERFPVFLPSFPQKPSTHWPSSLNIVGMKNGSGHAFANRRFW